MVKPQLWSSLRAGADKEAKNEVSERKNYTHTYGWQDALKEQAPCGLSPPRYCYSTSTCSLGPGSSGATFFPVFSPVVNEPFEGCQMQEKRIIPFV